MPPEFRAWTEEFLRNGEASSTTEVLPYRGELSLLSVRDRAICDVIMILKELELSKPLKIAQKAWNCAAKMRPEREFQTLDEIDAVRKI